MEETWSRWKMPAKVVKNRQAKVLRDFQVQTDKLVAANQADKVVVNKQLMKAMLIDVASDSEVKREEYEMLKKYNGLKEELKWMWGVKATVVAVVIGAHGDVNPQPGTVAPAFRRHHLRSPGSQDPNLKKTQRLPKGGKWWLIYK